MPVKKLIKYEAVPITLEPLANELAFAFEI